MSIALEQVTKRYHDSPVVNDVTLDVGAGEFFVLLGPSGSGKSTLLRAIAGLTGIDRGRISLRGRDVTRLPVRRREVGFVFQNYALFRHMSVADNIEFALRVRRVARSARLQRRRELLRLVALEGMDDRLPAQLSGGQQQRVAVARALAHEPGVLLMDEPFGALDARIRDELRRTIRRVQRELGITTILVTHDQEEAFALADRIGVMHQGRLLEVGEPESLYARPGTRFVATFLGAANLLITKSEMAASGSVAVVRPEDVIVGSEGESTTGRRLGAGRVEERTFSGAIERLRIRVTLAPDVMSATGEPERIASEGILVEAVRTQADQRALQLVPGDRVCVAARRIHRLETPIVAFTIDAVDADDAARLGGAPVVSELLAGTQAPVTALVTRRAEDTAARPAVPGIVVLRAGPGTAARATGWIESGAAGVLLLPAFPSLPQQIWIHAASPEARNATLAMAASVLRHFPAEAIYAGGAAADRTAALAELHEVRALARERHELDLRTELGWFSGDLAADRPGSARSRLNIVGAADGADLDRWFRSLESGDADGSWLFVLERAGESQMRSLTASAATS